MRTWCIFLLLNGRNLSHIAMIKLGSVTFSDQPSARKESRKLMSNAANLTKWGLIKRCTKRDSWHVPANAVAKSILSFKHGRWSNILRIISGGSVLIMAKSQNTKNCQIGTTFTANILKAANDASEYVYIHKNFIPIAGQTI